jgi:hypothetical protein
MKAWVHTNTKPQISSTRSRGLGWRIHGSVEDTKLSTNKQLTLSRFTLIPGEEGAALRHRGRMGEPATVATWGPPKCCGPTRVSTMPVILVMEAQLAVLSSSKRLLADAGPPAVLAPAPDAAMLADAGAPAVLAPAPLAVIPRSPCIVPSGGCAGRCWRPRSRCTCS